ncbi:MAG: hypothetical protein ACM35G_06820 [Planctomycetaceae bacterium]
MKTADPREVKTALLDVIRTETALCRYPMHRLARPGTVPIEIREMDANGELALRWEVSHNSKYGQPGPLAYKLDTVIVNRRVERAGRPVPGLLRLGSLNDISRELGLAVSGKNTTDIKRALLQNAFAGITAKIRYRSAEGGERELDSNFTRYEVHFSGEQLPDGRKADAVYLVLGDTYRRILDAALTRPLDHAYLRTLAPIAQRWYELASYRMFAALKRHWPRVRLSYAEFCTYAPQTRYGAFWEVRRQMVKVHAPHLDSGYITRIELEARTAHDGQPDWLMHYTPGPRARAEYQAFARKGGPVVLEAEPVKPEPEPTGLEQELVVRGVTASAARELVATYSAGRVKAKIEHVDWLREKRPKKIADVGAYLADAIRSDYAAPAGSVSRAAREQAEQERRQREAEDRRAKARRQEDQARIDAYWQALALEQQVRLEADAVEQADPAMRARCEAGTPRMRAMARRVIREAHIRSLLDPPVVG